MYACINFIFVLVLIVVDIVAGNDKSRLPLSVDNTMPQITFHGCWVSYVQGIRHLWRGWVDRTPLFLICSCFWGTAIGPSLRTQKWHLTSCKMSVATTYIPLRKRKQHCACKIHDCVVSQWKSRCAFRNWKSAGWPRGGLLYDKRRNCKQEVQHDLNKKRANLERQNVTNVQSQTPINSWAHPREVTSKWKLGRRSWHSSVHMGWPLWAKLLRRKAFISVSTSVAFSHWKKRQLAYICPFWLAYLLKTQLSA